MGRVGHVNVDAALVYQHRRPVRDRAIEIEIEGPSTGSGLGSCMGTKPG